MSDQTQTPISPLLSQQPAADPSFPSSGSDQGIQDMNFADDANMAGGGPNDPTDPSEPTALDMLEKILNESKQAAQQAGANAPTSDEDAGPQFSPEELAARQAAEAAAISEQLSLIQGSHQSPQNQARLQQKAYEEEKKDSGLGNAYRILQIQKKKIVVNQ